MAYPDAVALIVAYLAGLHSGTTVASRVPSPRPAEWIQVRQVSGTDLRPVRDLITLDVFYWAATEPAASSGGRTVRAEIHALAKSTTLGIPCYRVEEVLQRQTDDPLLGTPGWWATYSLTLRADSAIA